MNTYLKLSIAGVVLGTGCYLAGYYKAAGHIKTVVQIKEVVRTQEQAHRTTTTETKHSPSGESTTHTVVVEDISKIVSESNSERVRQVVAAPSSTTRRKTNVSALVAVDSLKLTPTYGIGVTHELIGPITIGAFGLTNGVVGLSIGISF